MTSKLTEFFAVVISCGMTVAENTDIVTSVIGLGENKLVDEKSRPTTVVAMKDLKQTLVETKVYNRALD